MNRPPNTSKQIMCYYLPLWWMKASANRDSWGGGEGAVNDHLFFFLFVRLSCSLAVSLKVSFMRRFEQHIRLKSPHGWYDADSGLWVLWPNRDPLWSKCLNVLSYFCCNEGTSKGFRTQHVARPALNQKLFVPALKGWHVVLKACWSPSEDFYFVSLCSRCKSTAIFLHSWFVSSVYQGK